MKYYYDLHIHSCLSACADDDMTPSNIAGMASLNGLNILALTDHNSTANCPAFFRACKRYGIIPIAGMELTTAEEIHMIILFPELDVAMEFNSALDSYRIKIKNKVDIFGAQLITDEEDSVISSEEYLLSVATSLDIFAAVDMAKQYGAVIYPAHIDREANGIISILGSWPSSPEFRCCEFASEENVEKYVSLYSLQNKDIVVSSDAHNLWSINDNFNYFDIDDSDGYSSASVRAKLLASLK